MTPSRPPPSVFDIPALAAGIHVFSVVRSCKTWMPGTRPGMTEEGVSAFYRARLFALHLRHLLQHGADRGGILRAVAALHRLQVDRLGSVEHRSRHADLADVV